MRVVGVVRVVGVARVVAVVRVVRVVDDRIYLKSGASLQHSL